MIALRWHVLRLPLLLSLLWCLLLFALFQWTVQREGENATELAQIQTRTLFSSIVNTRGWNADRGGVWATEQPNCQPNPWLPEDQRTLLTADGRRLVRFNPAYMTRQIAERFQSKTMNFHICGLSPKRPQNRPDQWETSALLDFDAGKTERFQLVPGRRGAYYRYMAPLRAEESCLQCHQRNKIGDVLGGISVSISAEPLFAAATERKRTTGLAFGIIGIIGMVGIGGATFQINRKKELAEAANRTKSAFLANMTHDMRTPLTGILGMTELLERETQDSRHRYLLANLRKATDSLLTVVDGIMRYSLLEADRQPTCCAPFSLRAELGACIAVLRPACASRDIRLSLVTDDTVPDRLVGDGFRLRQALGNLLGNAVKFTEKGSVALRVTRAESQAPEGRCALSFQVIDTGRGIPTDEQERIFESFEQGSGVRDSGDQHETGVGLGLAIARNIARRFGGDLTLSSTPGMGSVFTFTALFRLAADSDGLPETPASPCPASPSPLAQPDRPAETGTSGRLVVAEDTAVTALFLSEALTQAGYAAHMASSGEDALYLIRKLQPDAVLLDMRLPDMTGLDIAGQIRSGELGVAPETPILVLTATLDPGDEQAFRRMGINRWLLKPVQAGKLASVVADLLPFTRKEQEETPMPASEPAEQPADVFDPAAALDALGGEALLKRLAGIFLGEEPNIRANLQRFALSPETLPELCPELRRQAHSLKNGAGMLHLESLRKASSDLEQAAASPAGQDFAALLRTTIEALERASAALRKHCGA